MSVCLELSVDGGNARESARLAGELEEALVSCAEGVSVRRSKESDETMDLGATIAVVAGSAAATAIGRGVANWLTKRQSARVTVRRNGVVVAENVTSADAVRLAELAIGRSGSD